MPGHLITRRHVTLAGVERIAVYSPCERYRYSLLIRWDATKPPKCFIGLNPSTATELEDDPTIRRCMDFARRWGAGGLLMLNACAYRATDPREMLRFEGDKVGEHNKLINLLLNILGYQVGIPIAAWGKHASEVTFEGQDLSSYLKKSIAGLDCLAVNKDGTPSHPLYLRGDLRPRPFNYEKEASK